MLIFALKVSCFHVKRRLNWDIETFIQLCRLEHRAVNNFQPPLHIKSCLTRKSIFSRKKRSLRWNTQRQQSLWSLCQRQSNNLISCFVCSLIYTQPFVSRTYRIHPHIIQRGRRCCVYSYVFMRTAQTRVGLGPVCCAAPHTQHKTVRQVDKAWYFTRD